jgi:hypothetical protein
VSATVWVNIADKYKAIFKELRMKLGVESSTPSTVYGSEVDHKIRLLRARRLSNTMDFAPNFGND